MSSAESSGSSHPPTATDATGSAAGSVPLIVKCAASDGRTKRLHFASAAEIEYEPVRRRIARSLQLYDDWAAGGSGLASKGRAVFDLSYMDDDGEVCDVACQEDWEDALAFFCPSFLWDAIVEPGLASELHGSHSVEVRLSVKMRTSLALSDWGTESDLSAAVSQRTHSSYAIDSSARSSRHDVWESERSWPPTASGPYQSQLTSALSPFRPPSPASPGLVADLDSLDSDHRKVRFSTRVLLPSENGSSFEPVSAAGSGAGLAAEGRISMDLDPRATMSSLSLGGAARSHDGSLASLDLGPRPAIQPSPWGRSKGSQTLPAPPSVFAPSALSSSNGSPPHLQRPSMDSSARASMDGPLFDDGLSQLGLRSELGTASVSGTDLSRALHSGEKSPSTSEVYEGRRLQLSSLQMSDADALGLRLRLGLNDVSDLHTAPAHQAESALSLTHSVFSGDEAACGGDDILSELARGRESRPPSFQSTTSAAQLSRLNSISASGEKSKFTRFSAADAVFLQICQRAPPPPRSESGSSGTARSGSSRSDDTVVPPDEWTCSQCQSPLGGGEGMGLRYVCDMCGPRRFGGTGSSQGRSSSVEAADGFETASSVASPVSSVSASQGQETAGYELCAACISTCGAQHVSHTAPNGPSVLVPQPDRQRLHAFFELMWNDDVRAWFPIEEQADGVCSACSRSEWRGGHYRCSQCDNYHLCGVCFMVIDRLHAQHLFTRLPTSAPAPPAASAPAGSSVVRAGKDPTDAVHAGVACASCGQYPIVGVRVHCISCPGGRDFCAVCDERGLSLQQSRRRILQAGERAVASEPLPLHSQQHICLKLITPIDRRNARTAAAALEQAADRLLQFALRGPVHPWQVPASHVYHQHHRSINSATSVDPGEPPPFGATGTMSVSSSESEVADFQREDRQQNLPYFPQCNSCGKSFAGGVRYLCSRCPVEGTGGFNLCASCEPYSLLVHNPTHIFLKINRSYSMVPTRQVPFVPPLYSNEAIIPEIDCPAAERLWDALLDSSGLSTIDARRHLDPLVAALPPRHPLREKVPRILTLRVQLHHAMVAAGPSVVPPELGPVAAGGEESEAETETPGSVSARGSIAARERARVSATPSQAVQQVVQSLLSELHLVPVNQLVHVYIVCDSCFDVVEGAWLRCANCTDSVDLCARCEMRADHDASHVFAVFKQSIDPGLFRSLVDHAPTSNALGHAAGPYRAMLPSLLFA